jgi:hypothetical protein
MPTVRSTVSNAVVTSLLMSGTVVLVRGSMDCQDQNDLNQQLPSLFAPCSQTNYAVAVIEFAQVDLQSFFV